MAPPWIIISTVNQVSYGNNFDLEHDLSAPPTVCVPTLQQMPGAKIDGFPDASIEAFDPSMWLLRYPPYHRSIASEQKPRFIITNFGKEAERTNLNDDVKTEIRDFPDDFFDKVNKVGIVANPYERGHFVIADLRILDASIPLPGNTRVPTAASREFVFYSSIGSCWNTEVHEGLITDKGWKFNDVISHAGKLWWVDHSKGLIWWNPFRSNGEVAQAQIRLPEPVGDEEKGAAAVSRYLQLGDGFFRYLTILMPNPNRSAVVKVRTLEDPFLEVWSYVDYEFKFSQIWDTPGYQEIVLPRMNPDHFALMDPQNPDVMFFFFEHFIFGVDGRAKLVKGGYEKHGLGNNPTSASVRGWILPPKIGFE